MKNTIRIYHNPACGTSRNTLAIIRNTGEEPEIIEYLDNPPSRTELAYLINSAKLTVREAIRKNVEPYTQLGLENDVWTDDELLTYMLQHNEHHAQELDQMADNLAKMGMDAACKTIKEAVADFQKGNMRLGLALTLVKEEMK